eukprot:421736-Hanusia_phi.AAC.2
MTPTPQSLVTLGQSGSDRIRPLPSPRSPPLPSPPLLPSALSESCVNVETQLAQLNEPTLSGLTVRSVHKGSPG